MSLFLPAKFRPHRKITTSIQEQLIMSSEQNNPRGEESPLNFEYQISHIVPGPDSRPLPRHRLLRLLG